MPTYDYKCSKCNHIETILHSIKVELKPVCTKCGSKMTKQISGTGCIRFKGEGFHCNDYKRKKENEL